MNEPRRSNGTDGFRRHFTAGEALRTRALYILCLDVLVHNHSHWHRMHLPACLSLFA